MRKKIKVVKWTIGFITLLYILINLVAKIIHLTHLQSVDWNLISYSAIDIFLILVGSILFLGLAFLERAIHKDSSLKSPEQVIVLFLGFTGIVYASILIFFKAKQVGWL